MKVKVMQREESTKKMIVGQMCQVSLNDRMSGEVLMQRLEIDSVCITMDHLNVFGACLS